jgi:hypothetical protein
VAVDEEINTKSLPPLLEFFGSGEEGRGGVSDGAIRV